MENVNARRNKEENVNEGVLPQSPQGSQGPQDSQVLQDLIDVGAMKNVCVRPTLQILNQAMTIHGNRDIRTHVNP